MELERKEVRCLGCDADCRKERMEVDGKRNRGMKGRRVALCCYLGARKDRTERKIWN